MPRGDGTGPMGMGPMTGRRSGYCAGYAMPGCANARFGMGRARGFRRMYYATGVPGWARYGATGIAPYRGAAPDVDEKDALKRQADYLERELKEVRERLKDFR